MQHWKSIPIPALMQSLERDRRGYPVPVIVMRDTDGRPHFTINDELERQRVIQQRLCSICGKPLHKVVALVGGPGSALHPQGAFLDPPTHRECATYAVQVCPYLAAPNYARRIDDATLDPAKLPAHYTGTVDHTVLPDRPDVFVLLIARKLNYVPYQDNPDFIRIIRPVRPYVKTEFWRNGEKLEELEGRTLAANALTKLHGGPHQPR